MTDKKEKTTEVPEHAETDDDLFDELIGDVVEVEKIPDVKELLPKKVYLSDRCLKLGQMIGPISNTVGKQLVEVGGFFLTDLDDPLFTLGEFHVPNNLSVTIGDILIAEHYDQAAQENRKYNKEHDTKRRIGAMFHIHPYKSGGLHHSGQDDKQLIKLENKLAKTTMKIFETPYNLIESKIKKEYGEDALCLKGDVLSDAIKKFYYPDDEMFFNVLQSFGLEPLKDGFKKADFLAKLLETIDEHTYEPRSVNYAISMVFNNGFGFPYMKIGYREEFSLTKKKKYDVIDTIPIEIVEEGINLPSADEVKKLVKKRIVFPKRVKGKYFGKGKGAKTIPVTSRGRTAGTVYPSTYSYTTTTGKTLRQRLESLVVPEQPSNDDDLFSEITGEVPSVPAPRANSVQLPYNQVLKINDDTYTTAEIIEQFTIAAYGYTLDHRHTDCKYSTFMAVLLDYMGIYESSSGNIINQISFFTPAKKKAKGIISSIVKIGELLEDNPFVVEKHDLPAYKIRNIKENIMAELKQVKDNSYVVDFMIEFIDTPTSLERSKVIEKYVQPIFEKVSKK